LSVVRDVERERQCGVGVLVGQVLHLRDLARGDDDVVPAGEGGLGEGAAEAGGAAGDEPGGHVVPFWIPL
jgi:hypothetical protein